MLTNVQALRALAAFLVVFVHLQALATRLGLGPSAFEFGNSGVDLFFVISGMIMVLTTSRSRPDAAEFMRNRIARVAPFYWLVTLGVFGLALAAPALFQGTEADPGYLLKSLFFVPYQRPDGMLFPIVFVGWTLNYEMAFYVLFALGLALRSERAGFLFTLGVLAAAVAGGLAIGPASPVARFYSAPIVLEFGLGMLIGRFAYRLRAVRARSAATLAVGVCAFVFMVSAAFIWPGAERLLIFGLPAAVVVLSAVQTEREGAVLRRPAVKLLGDASFAIYLTHFFVTQAAVKAVERFGLTQPWQLILAIVCAFAAVAVVGVGVHLYVERPVSRMVRNLLGGRRPLAARPTPGSASAA